MAEGMVRMSLELSPDLHQILEDLVKRTHSSKSEILRKAIHLMNMATEASEKGKLFGVTNADGKLETRILVP